MSTKQLLDRWSENKDRLHWIQANRHEIEAATGVEVPKRLHEIEAWLDGHKPVVTRKLREAVDGEDGGVEESADADPDVNTEDDNE